MLAIQRWQAASCSLGHHSLTYKSTSSLSGFSLYIPTNRTLVQRSLLLEREAAYRTRRDGSSFRMRAGGPNQGGPKQRKEGGGAPAKRRMEELLDEAESEELTEEEFNAMLDELDAELEEDFKAGRIKEVDGVLVEVDPEEEKRTTSQEIGASIEDEEAWKKRVVAEIQSWAEDEDEFEEDFEEFDDFEEGDFEEDVLDGLEYGPDAFASDEDFTTSSKNLISEELGSETKLEAPVVAQVEEEKKEETPEEAEERRAMEMALSEINTWQERKLRWALEKSEHRRHKLEIKRIVSDTKLPRRTVLAWLKIHIKEPPRPLEPAVLKTRREDSDETGEGATEASSEDEERWGPSRKRIKKVNLETFEKIYRVSPQPSREQIQDMVKLTHIPYKRVAEWFDERNGVTPETNADNRNRRKDERKKKKRGTADEERVSPPMTMIEPDSDGVSLQQ